MKSETGTNKAKKNNILFGEYKKHADLMLMFLPGLILLIIFKYIPLGGVTLAFKDYVVSDGILGSRWVGMEHFSRLFAGEDFLHVLKNTLVISLLKLILGFPLPIILALLLNEVRSVKFKKTVQTMSYLPYFFSWIVLAGIISMLFSTRGPVNVLLMKFGLSKPLEFYADGKLFISLLIISAMWQGTGWSAVIFLASVSGISEDLYEAARIDGAGRWRQTLSITIPCLVPTIVTVFILNLGSVMNAGFDQIYNMYNPVVYDVSDIIDTYVLRRMQGMDYSLSTAAGLFKSVVTFVLMIISNWAVGKMSDNELGIW